MLDAARLWIHDRKVGKIKGAVLVEVVKFLRSRRQEVQPLLPGELHHYLEERVLANGWYPETDYFELLHVVAQLFDARGQDPWIMMGVSAARSNFDSAYRLMVRSGDPVGTLNQFPLLWQIRHDTGTVEVAIESSRSGRVTLRDYVLVSHEICKAIQGTIIAMVQRSGAENVEVEKAQCRSDGAEVCIWSVSWG